MKAIYLISESGTFIAFGPGMVVYTTIGPVMVANTNRAGTWECRLCFPTTSEPEAAAAAWFRAIATAPDGATLSWDDDECGVRVRSAIATGDGWLVGAERIGQEVSA